MQHTLKLLPFNREHNILHLFDKYNKMQTKQTAAEKYMDKLYFYYCKVTI